MHTYLIHKKIPTPIMIYDGPIIYEGYEFEQFGDFQSHDGLLVKRCETGETYMEAYITFLEGLVPVLNALSVVTQCVIRSLAKGSHFIFRQDNNPLNIALLYLANDTTTTGLDFNSTTATDIKKLLNANIDVGLELFREANHASSPKTMLAMLLTSAEALAGEVQIPSSCSKCGYTGKLFPNTNKVKLKEIISPALYSALYTKTRIRHKLFHGGKIDESLAIQYSKELYNNILFNYLKPTYDLQDVEHNVVQAPRNNSFEYTSYFVKIPNITDLNLRTIEQKADSDTTKYIGTPPLSDY